MKTKKGAASLYVVIFTALLFGIITLSFVRLIVSEVNKTADDDLSQSAYDAALAGVEDAKVAILAASNNGKLEDLLSRNDCRMVMESLYGENMGEVKLQETYRNNNDENVSQAYTCVILEGDLPNYEGTLNSSKMEQGIDMRDNASSLADHIVLEWGDVKKEETVRNDGLFGANDSTPPVLSVTLVYDNDVMSTLILQPSSKDEAVVEITSDQVSNSRSSVDSVQAHTPYLIKHSSDNASFPYSVRINSNIGGNLNLVTISSPYGDEANFRVIKYDDKEEIIDFHSQIEIDSTGRANDLYRRVRSRVNLDSGSEIYPGYALHISGDEGTDEGNGLIKKNFYVTRDSKGDLD